VVAALLMVDVDHRIHYGRHQLHRHRPSTLDHAVTASVERSSQLLAYLVRESLEACLVGLAHAGLWGSRAKRALVD